MTRIFIAICCVLLVVACDFGFDEKPHQKDPVTIKTQKPSKPSNNQEYYKKKNNNSQTKPKQDGTKVVKPGQNLTTLQKDSIENKVRSNEEALKSENEKLRMTIQNLRKQTTIKTIVRSTYRVKHEQAVEGYLYGMYVKELQKLKAANKDEHVLSERYKKFFTIEYCDDRVLEWLDDFADRRIRSDARRMRLKYSRVSNPDFTGKQIISHK
jgi:hypothetical protein